MKRFSHSTNVVSADHKADTLTMVVEFKGGATYEYSNVPAHLYEALCASNSPGQYLRTNVIIPRAEDGTTARFPVRRIK